LSMSEPYYPPLTPFQTGLRGRCPRCGRGRLFAGYLTVAKSCASCKLDFSFADSGDGAAWFVIEVAYQPAWWVHVLIAIPVLIFIPAILLRPVKGLLLAQQWKTNASEGRIAK
jgi:uncharacterized protein (DUF983 family)